MPKEFKIYVNQLTSMERGMLFCLPSFIGQVVAQIDGIMDPYEQGRMMDMITCWDKIDGDFEKLMQAHSGTRAQSAQRIKGTIQSDADQKGFEGMITILEEFAAIIRKMPNTLPAMEEQRRSAIINGRLNGEIPVDLRSRMLQYVFDICMEVAAQTGGAKKISSKEQAIIEMIYDSFGMAQEPSLNLPWSRADESPW